MSGSRPTPPRPARSQVSSVQRIIDDILKSPSAVPTPQLLVLNKVDKVEGGGTAERMGLNGLDLEAVDWNELRGGDLGPTARVSALKGSGLDEVSPALPP